MSSVLVHVRVWGAKADEGRALVDVRHQASVKKRTLPDLSRNSLLSAWNSLLVEKISLIVRLGNFLESPCGAAVSCFEIVALGPEIVIFPVKFPVCREFRRRRVRCALRRQPAFSPLNQALFESAGFAIPTAPRLAKVEEGKIGLRTKRTTPAREWPRSARNDCPRLSSAVFPRRRPQRRARHQVRKRC